MYSSETFKDVKARYRQSSFLQLEQKTVLLKEYFSTKPKNETNTVKQADLKSSSKLSLPFAWITWRATDLSYTQVLSLFSLQCNLDLLNIIPFL